MLSGKVEFSYEIEFSTFEVTELFQIYLDDSKIVMQRVSCVAGMNRNVSKLPSLGSSSVIPVTSAGDNNDIDVWNSGDSSFEARCCC